MAQPMALRNRWRNPWTAQPVLQPMAQITNDVSYGEIRGSAQLMAHPMDRETHGAANGAIHRWKVESMVQPMTVRSQWRNPWIAEPVE